MGLSVGLGVGNSVVGDFVGVAVMGDFVGLLVLPSVEKTWAIPLERMMGLPWVDCWLLGCTLMPAAILGSTLTSMASIHQS